MISSTKKALCKKFKVNEIKLNDIFTLENQSHKIISIDRDEDAENYDSIVILSSSNDSDEMIERFSRFYEKQFENRAALAFRVKVRRDANRKIISA